MSYTHRQFCDCNAQVVRPGPGGEWVCQRCWEMDQRASAFLVRHRNDHRSRTENKWDGESEGFMGTLDCGGWLDWPAEVEAIERQLCSPSVS